MKIIILKILTVLLLLFNSVGAIYGGFNLFTDPSGESMQMPLDWLRNSPFNNYFIPGIILFLVNGIFGFLTVILLIIRHKKYPFFVIIQGILLGGWIIVQVILLNTIHFLHIMFFTIGAAILILGVLQKKLNIASQQ